MKQFLLLTTLLITLQMTAQNVGVGTSTPSEKLDVNGNINVTGTIKANGTDGQPNEVLMKNSSGNLAWGSLCDYKNFKQFVFAGANAQQTFTIPAGVTKVAVELWGGGGGGSQAGGGGGGGYVLAIINVVAGQNATIVVGGPGAGSTGTGNGSFGDNSSFVSGISQVAASGGAGAFSSFPGFGGSISSYTSDVIFLSQQGTTGRKNRETFGQLNATDFMTTTNYGNGGQAYGQPATGGEGGYAVTYNSTGFTYKEIFGSQGYSYGEGGGGGKSFGYPGAAGRVIVRW